MLAPFVSLGSKMMGLIAKMLGRAWKEVGDKKAKDKWASGEGGEVPDIEIDPSWIEDAAAPASEPVAKDAKDDDDASCGAAAEDVATGDDVKEEEDAKEEEQEEVKDGEETAAVATEDAAVCALPTTRILWRFVPSRFVASGRAPPLPSARLALCGSSLRDPSTGLLLGSGRGACSSLQAPSTGLLLCRQRRPRPPTPRQLRPRRPPTPMRPTPTNRHLPCCRATEQEPTGVPRP